MSQRLDQLRLQIDSVVAPDGDIEMERALVSSELAEPPLSQTDEPELSE